MNKHQFFIVLIGLFLLFHTAIAQQSALSSTNKKAIKNYRQAEQHYFNRNYGEALEYINRSLRVDASFLEAWMLLGAIHFDLKENEQAVDAYKKVLALDSTAVSIVYYMLGDLYYEEANYSEAVSHYKLFLQCNNISEKQQEMAKERLEHARIAKHAVENPTFTPINLGEAINTSADEYINFVDETESVLYVTRKELQDEWAANKKVYKEDFYIARSAADSWSEPIQLKADWKGQYNAGGMSLSVDGRSMYFTGCYWPGGLGSCDLYVSKRIGDSWQAPHNIGKPINTSDWESQAVVSSDGSKLYFASRRSGGKGGSDIWMSVRLKSGRWSPAVNLGDSINTNGNEMAPFLHADGQTLYFSSDGHGGLGGYDLFISRKDFSGQWTKGKNIGYPINSPDDELNIFINLEGTKAWLSSNRSKGSGGFDVYVVDTDPLFKPSRVVFLKGKVLDASSGVPLGAHVILSDLQKGIGIDSTQADPVTGYFLLALHPHQNYAVNIAEKGYLMYSENLDFNTDTARSYSKEFLLQPIEKGRSIILHNIFFDFNSAQLKPASHVELNRLVQLLLQHPDLRILISGHTDNIGSSDYNLKLSLERAESVRQYLLSHQIAPQRCEVQGSGAEQPIASNETDEGRAKNRRTTLSVL